MKRWLIGVILLLLSGTALPDDKELANVYYQSGLALFSQSKYDEAVIRFNRSLSYIKDFSPSLFKLGECYEKLKDNKKALKNYRLCLKSLQQRKLTKEEEDLSNQTELRLDKLDANGLKLKGIRSSAISRLFILADNNKKYPRFTCRVLRTIIDLDPGHKDAFELLSKLESSDAVQPNPDKPDIKKTPVKPAVEKLFNGKDMGNWQVAGEQQGYQSWRIEGGQLAGGSKMAHLESYFIWQGTLPENYKISIKFYVERTYTVYTNHVGLVYAQSGATYNSVQLNSKDSGTTGTLVFIKQDGKCKSLLNGKVVNENLILSGTPIVGLMAKNSQVYFSNITLEELK
ncbi:MAG: tetratricopeptide repeat protein [Planctomycetota bacterium]